MSTVTCPGCGARNAASAPWCTQCYTPFGERHDPGTGDAPSPRAEPSERARTPEPAGPPGTPDDPAAGAVTTRHDVRQDEHGGIEWRCATCEGWSPLEAPGCVRCGAPRTGFGDDRDVEEVDEQRIMLLSGLLPGLGHISAGRMGSGIARAVFGLGWLLGGLLLLAAAVRAGSGHWAAVPLLGGAVIVWVLTVLDARALARGQQQELLGGRALLWLMVGVTSLLVVTLMLNAWRMTG